MNGSIKLALALSAAVIAVPAAAQTAAPDAVVAAARKAIAERYVLPEVAPKLDAALAKNAAAGRYRRLSGEALASAMSADLEAVAHDRHLSVSYNPQQAKLMADRPVQDDGPLPPSFARFVDRMNAGVRELRTMPGNIRYLAYDGFAWGTPGAPASVEAAMRFLQGADAYIIDLRRNGGGSPEAVAALASYFVPEGTPLMRFEMRGRAGEATKSPKAPFSLAGKPLYVLTSGGTASAAEEFATHVQALGFGTLIGERTAGAGFRNDLLPLPGGYVLSVSTGRAISLKTGKDWERVGVTPTIVVPVDRALERAQQEAMQKIAAAAPADERAQDDLLVGYYRALAEPVALARPAADYAGRYGERTVTAVGGALTFRRLDRPPLKLVPVDADTFASEADGTVRISFITESGRVAKMRIVQGDGSESIVPRG